ncbi:MAG: polysaccharide deacetylase family protein [candidate division Zixibacteria bacterium]|nr:polysaccharide deacetylase family protein [candidate division Zixibacteria bacterium]
MRRYCVIGLLALLLSATVTGAAAQDKGTGKAKKKAGEICITFDELPASQAFGEVDREAVTYLLLQALKKHNVKAAGFVVGQQIDGSYDILGQWLNDGHLLGSMTLSNQDLHQLGIEQFISDISAGHEALETMLSGFGQKKRYFRYPFLHYGNTVESKRQVKLYLEEFNITPVHATVVIEDYLFNLSLEKMGKLPDSAAYENLMNEYINHVIDEIEKSKRLAKEVLKRSCRHILRLKANRLNAVYLDEMLTALEGMGYKFISLDRALKDELYSAPEAYFGPRGVSYIEMIKQSDMDLLPAE